METASDYWDGVGYTWREQQPDALWREFTDHQQLGLIEAWLPLACSGAEGPPGEIFVKLLKTDLFDEVAHFGLVPALLG